jgi:hypothetical protein
MKIFFNILMMLLLFTSFSFAQMTVLSSNDRLSYDPADTLKPWINDNGVRSVHVTDDLDGDGKLEILATDYTNGGRVHVFEYTGTGALELVWSSPAGLWPNNPNSTPRWVQHGDLDGDGNKEIIWPSGPRYTGQLQVWENVGDNDYGTSSIIDLPGDLHVGLGIGEYRFDRERGTVYDFDGDGKSELIMCNADHNTYILSINGNAPGFASWQIEGGDPNVHPNNGFANASWWHSIPVDYDGDGVKEIVVHHWNFYGFWSIEPTGANTYTYPPGNGDGGVFGPTYYEFYRTRDVDGVGFMGITAADVDGDGKDEIAGLVYPLYELSLIAQPQGVEGVEIWDDSLKMGIIGPRDVMGLDETSQYWGCYAVDLNQNGRDEILVGGFDGYEIVAMEYSGTGDILDASSYTKTIYYPGPGDDEQEWSSITISDSAGVVDTSYNRGAWATPGVMKFSQGDFTGDGNPELVVSYQADFYDSTTITHRTWNGSAWEEVEEKIQMEPQINIRLLSYDGATGISVENIDIITPEDYVLNQNYPNPFNPTTTIRFSLPLEKEISLVVYDMLGREVKTLIANQEFSSGSYEVTWDATNNMGSKVVSGNYIATLKFGNFTKSIKMMLLK